LVADRRAEWDALIERSWRTLVETGSCVVDFDNHEDGDAWRAALRRRAREQGRKINTLRGRSNDPIYPLLELRVMAVLPDWGDQRSDEHRAAEGRKTADVMSKLFDGMRPSVE
jgi:hypothetical protein